MAAHPELSLHEQGWPGAASLIMTLPPLGLDVAKLKFNACLLRADGKPRHQVFPNNPDGFAQLSDWLNKQGDVQVHACLEATGTYGDALATYLHGQEHRVSVVNPAAIKAYAQSRLSRTKTDRVDAALIAGFCLGAQAARLAATRAGTPRVAGTCAPPRLTRRDAHDGGEPPLLRHRGGGRARVGHGVDRAPLGAGSATLSASGTELTAGSRKPSGVGAPAATVPLAPVSGFTAGAVRRARPVRSDSRSLAKR